MAWTAVQFDVERLMMTGLRGGHVVVVLNTRPKMHWAGWYLGGAQCGVRHVVRVLLFNYFIFVLFVFACEKVPLMGAKKRPFIKWGPS